MKKSAFDTKRIVVIAMLTAVSFLAVLVGKLVPNIAGFLSYDPKDAVIAIGGFMLGPVAALIVTVLVSLIEMVSISTTGPYGLIMNIFSTCAFVLPAAIVYKNKRTMKGAVIGLVSGMVAMTVCMLLWNYIITPGYMGVDRSVVAGMLPTVFLPFNLIKSGINTGIALVLYKPLVIALRKAHLVPAPTNTVTGNTTFRFGMTLISLVILIVFIVLFIIVF